MGKGTIIYGGDYGQYQVQINYDHTQYDKLIAALDQNITTLETKIAGLEIGTSKYNIAVLQKTALEKRKEELEARTIKDETISAWCADLTEDLSGEVGTVEIPGESANIQIQPGFENNAVYNKARDGQLVPTFSMGGAQAFYNLAMLPGWQKWKPTFRYGTITAIDGETASVTIDGIKSSQQSLDINQTDTLSDVPFEYMNCDSGAFEEGDEVLIKFEGQAWESPKIIGFKDNPKPCHHKIVIRPTFNGHYASYGKQRIMYTYQFGGEEKIGWFQIYGSDYNVEIQTVEGCSPIFEFDTFVEFDAFKNTAKFYVASTLSNSIYSKGGTTFYHFYCVDVPVAFLTDKIYFETQVGTGDGTTQPILYPVNSGDYDFSTDPEDYIEVSAYDINGDQMSATLDVYGFPQNGEITEGHFNVSTGKWDIPLVWNRPVGTEQAITIKWFARDNADAYYFKANWEKQLIRRVDYLEADNNILNATKTSENINGQDTDVYQIDFTGLKIIKREATGATKANKSGACYKSGTPLSGSFNPDYVTWSARIVDATYMGYVTYSDIHQRFSESYYYNSLGETDIPYYYTSCSTQREMAYTIALSSTDIRWIISDSDGLNPTFASLAVEIHEWFDWMEYGMIDDPWDGCYFPDGYCGIKTWHWDYKMIDTPAEAF